MSFLHSFLLLGRGRRHFRLHALFCRIWDEHWKILTLIWALVPLVNIFQFLTCPIDRLVEEGGKSPASETAPTAADVAHDSADDLLRRVRSDHGAVGVCIYRVSARRVQDDRGSGWPVSVCRFHGNRPYAIRKNKWKIESGKTMLISGILCVACYLLASLAPLPILGLTGCALCGFSVGIMWPGTISLSSQKCPQGGTAMFAFLALAGDLGGTVSPAMVGSLSELAGGNLKIGLSPPRSSRSFWSPAYLF